MKPVKITVKDHVGREVNPHSELISPSFALYGSKGNPEWADFEAAIHEHPCPELANTKPGETVMAELVWQERRFGEEWDNIDAPTNESQWTRQIYRLVPKKEKGAVHELKTVQPFFTQIKQGKKTFELRKNDRGFKIGDTLLLKEYTIPDHDFMGGDEYSGKSISVKVIGMLENYRGLEEGYCIMSIQVL